MADIKQYATATAADDDFHPVGSDSPWWTETVWFSFNVPERRLMVSLNPWWRPNLGVLASAVKAWDDTAEEPWEVPFYQEHRQLAFDPRGQSLRDIEFPDGVQLQCIEPLTHYRIRYAWGDVIDLDVEFRASTEVLYTRFDDVVKTFVTGGHLDQTGRVTGRCTLRGETFDVDCYAMRDRSWMVRSDFEGLGAPFGYTYGTADDDTSFLVATTIDPARGTDTVLWGYHRSEGELSPLVSGSRTVERDRRGRPTKLIIDAVDALGRAMHTSGECVNRLAHSAYPSMFCWLSLSRFELDGRECWGENQDVWPAQGWQPFTRAHQTLS